MGTLIAITRLTISSRRGWCGAPLYIGAGKGKKVCGAGLEVQVTVSCTRGKVLEAAWPSWEGRAKPVYRFRGPPRLPGQL